MAIEGLQNNVVILCCLSRICYQWAISGRDYIESIGSQLVWILAIIIFFGLFGGIVAIMRRKKVMKNTLGTVTYSMCH